MYYTETAKEVIDIQQMFTFQLFGFYLITL